MEMAHGFVDSYRRHMAKEETDFFPEALRALTPQEWAEIETRITNPTDPVFESRAAARLVGTRGSRANREHRGRPVEANVLDRRRVPTHQYETVGPIAAVQFLDE